MGYQKILRNVGWALLWLGVVDVGVMIYCIANNIGYSSSFNIFAIIAGVFLIRGSLKAARLVAWFSAFLLSAFAGIALVMCWNVSTLLSEELLEFFSRSERPKSYQKLIKPLSSVQLRQLAVVEGRAKRVHGV
jgi:hypothetical protein